MDYHDKAHKHCAGEFWTINAAAAKCFGINHIKSEPGGGLCARPNTIRQGGNSGFQAVSLAILFGAKRVILLGFDMQFTGRRSHWHGDHQGKLHNPVPKRFENWIRNFEKLGKESGIEIINASRQTALKCFPRRALNESLAES